MTRRHRPTPPWLPVAILLAGLGFSCAFGAFRPGDPMGHQFNLEKSQKDNTDAVRWAKFDEAASYLDPGERTAFLAQMPDFDDGRFTDWEAGPWEFEDPETLDRATIAVTYRGYSMHNPFEFQIEETQEWSRNGRANHWMVVSSFKDLGQISGQ